MPFIAIIMIAILPVGLVGCFGDTGVVQDRLPRYSDMGAAADAGKVKGE